MENTIDTTHLYVCDEVIKEVFEKKGIQKNPSSTRAYYLRRGIFTTDTQPQRDAFYVIPQYNRGSVLERYGIVYYFDKKNKDRYVEWEMNRKNKMAK